MVPNAAPKKCIILYYRSNYRQCLQSARYKFCNLTSFIRPWRKIKNANKISLKFIMLQYNNQIFRNWLVIINYHLTKVSSQINKCIIFEPKKNSITLSSYPEWPHRQGGCLACWRLQGRKIESWLWLSCTDLYFALGAQGVLPMRVGVRPVNWICRL